MDFETQKRKRMEALEDKKKRLELLKQNRLEKDKLSEQTPSTDSQNNRVDSVDNIINSIFSASDLSTQKSDLQSTSETVNAVVSFNKLDYILEKKKCLSTLKLLSFSFYEPPPEIYDKHTQTDDIVEPHSSLIESPDSSVARSNFRRTNSGANKSSVQSTPAANVSLNFEGMTTAPSPILREAKKLSEEDQQEILSSTSFKSFVITASRLIERSIGQSKAYDIFVDYSNDDESRAAAEGQVTFSALFDYEYEAVKSRPVMDLQISPHHPELFLAAYGSKGQISNNNKGSWQAPSGNRYN